VVLILKFLIKEGVFINKKKKKKKSGGGIFFFLVGGGGGGGAFNRYEAFIREGRLFQFN